MTDPDTTTPDAATLMGESFAAINDGDLETLKTFWHDDIVEDFVVLGPIKGKHDVAAFFAELFAAVPDLEFTTERIMPIDATTAVGEWALRGTLSGGPFQGVEANGSDVSLRGVDVMTFEDGLLRHNTIYYDGLTFARQIGMLPSAGSKTDRAMMASFNGITKVKGRLGR